MALVVRGIVRKISRPMAWLSDDDYRRVQRSVPIACVDIAPLQLSSRGTIESIGLILRDTPHQGRRWCLVGGRIMRDESITEAAARHLRQTLGAAIRFTIAPDAQPIYVSQYFTSRREVGVIDPRQHSIAVNYLVAVAGPVTPEGEAHEFRWFPANALPGPHEFGFEQDRVLAECLRRGV
jgi:ADP-ribose pyrophosphatase YjhB (NUDIX family)